MGKLWVRYFETLVKHCIEGLRLVNWSLSLDTIEKMITIFRSSGNFLYAKSARLFLKTARRLPEIRLPEEFKKFTESFAIRITDKYWNGLFTDYTIESFYTKNLNILGGLVRRGFTKIQWKNGLQEGCLLFNFAT